MSKTKMISVLFPQTLLDKLDDWLEKQFNRTRADFIREAVIEKMDREAKEA